MTCQRKVLFLTKLFRHLAISQFLPFFERIECSGSKFVPGPKFDREFEYGFGSIDSGVVRCDRDSIGNLGLTEGEEEDRVENT